jgi:hypothetical protein
MEGVFSFLYTVQKEEPVRLILLMQRENILYMTDTTGVASFLVDFYVLYKFASLEYVECAGILITILITYSSDANLNNKYKSAKYEETHIALTIQYKG